MSIELHVLFAGKLPSKAALTRCFKQLGFPLTFRPGTGTLERQTGYLPMRLRGEESGVEFDTYNDRKSVEEVAGAGIDARFARSANFRWGGDENELAVALCFAAALAKLADGMVFDPQEGELQTAEQAIDIARKQIAATPPESKIRGTRPSDIKHYLKPLLQIRSDLALVRRLLLIRPVRHLIRGVVFQRRGGRYWLGVRRYLIPMFDIGPAVPQIIQYRSFETWEPHFQPLLIDRLAAEYFTELGSITTLLEYAEGSRNVFAYMTALVLAGRADKAREWLEEQDRLSKARGGSGVASDFSEHFERLVKDIKATCAACHAKEAEWVQALKLEHVWEPAPFPVELPVAQRQEAASDQRFVVTPWPVRPDWLWDEVPQRHAEVRYAKDWQQNGEEALLLVALTPAEAEERHRSNETYTLAARLPDGELLLVQRDTGYDRHDPEKDCSTGVSYLISLQTSSHQVVADTFSEPLSSKSARISSIEVRQRGSLYPVWSYLESRRDNEINVRDERSGESIFSEWTVTPEDHELQTLRGLAFGEYAVFVERMRSLLRVRGYGELT